MSTWLFRASCDEFIACVTKMPTAAAAALKYLIKKKRAFFEGTLKKIKPPV
jgi:hypothetical protein